MTNNESKQRKAYRTLTAEELKFALDKFIASADRRTFGEWYEDTPSLIPASGEEKATEVPASWKVQIGVPLSQPARKSAQGLSSLDAWKIRTAPRQRELEGKFCATEECDGDLEKVPGGHLHLSQPETWEKEFDEKFKKHLLGMRDSNIEFDDHAIGHLISYTHDMLKAFIASLLKKKDEEIQSAEKQANAYWLKTMNEAIIADEKVARASAIQECIETVETVMKGASGGGSWRRLLYQTLSRLKDNDKPKS